MDHSVMSEISQVPTKEYMAHLKDREGFRSDVYKDTEGKLTAGTGHLLSKQEYKDYGIVGWAKKKLKGISYHMAVNKDNEFITTSESQRVKWLEADSKKSYNHAKKQAAELGITNPSFINRLAHVNYQLGTGWRSKFDDAWGGLKDKNYQKAIDNIKWIDPSNPQKGMSSWYTETKNRAEKFQDAIEKLKSDTAFLMDPWNKEDNIFV